VKNKGGDLRVANLSEKVKNLFVITQLVKVFKTYESVDRAVASFRVDKIKGALASSEKKK
jgi:anti-sigma B factor antagonist